MKLTDYKGKFTIIMDDDKVGELDWVVGNITKEEIMNWDKDRIEYQKERAYYYGVPAICTSDPDLQLLFEYNIINNEVSPVVDNIACC